MKWHHQHASGRTYVVLRCVDGNDPVFVHFMVTTVDEPRDEIEAIATVQVGNPPFKIDARDVKILEGGGIEYAKSDSMPLEDFMRMMMYIDSAKAVAKRLVGKIAKTSKAFWSSQP